MPTNKRKVSSTKVTPVVAPRTKTVSKRATKVAEKKSDGVVASKAKIVREKVVSVFEGIVKSLKTPHKKAKKITKAERLENRQKKIRGIIGIGLLFVIVSIAYSTYMTNLFVDGTSMIIALAPQVTFAVITLVIAFYKIYK